MTNLQPLIDTVLEMDNYDQLKEVNQAVVERMRMLNSQQQSAAAMAFRVGQRVEFTNRNGITSLGVVRGTVVKVNRKTIKVDSVTGRWNVSPTLLREADESTQR